MLQSARNLHEDIVQRKVKTKRRNKRGSTLLVDIKFVSVSPIKKKKRKRRANDEEKEKKKRRESLISS